MDQTLQKRTVEWAIALINRPSITPEDAGCQTIIAEHLKMLGFTIELMPFEDTQNLWAIKPGELYGTPEDRVITFAGHTDVVPAGDSDAWHTPPFTATILGNLLYGRGAADMKGGLASMIVAVTEYIQNYPEHPYTLSFLLTSDEEGPFINGTTRVVDTLIERQQRIDYCIIGEPSSVDQLGDYIKNGRRGSLTGDLTVLGKQGHVAYPELVNNPIHSCLAVLDQLAKECWDAGNAFFPATSFQIVNINGGTGATNIVPGKCTIQFNFRFSSELTAEQIKQRVHALLDESAIHYRLSWSLSGDPFVTGVGQLSESAAEAIYAVTGIQTQLSTSGGTSDGRFLAKISDQVIELGPINKTIHQVNESVSIADLGALTEIYIALLNNLSRKENNLKI